MKSLKSIFLSCLIILLLSFSLYASENTFELIAPSSYKPANLLTEFDEIDGGNYRLRLHLNIASLFKDQSVARAAVFLVIPANCVINEISIEYKIHHRMDYNYYVFYVSSENNLLVDVVLDLRMSVNKANNFGFVVVAYDEQGKQLIYEQHGNGMHKDIILREYLVGLQ